MIPPVFLHRFRRKKAGRRSGNGARGGGRAFGKAIALLALLLAAGGSDVRAEAIRISGTGGAMGTMRILGAAFRKANPRFRVDITPGMGSSGAIRAVQAGRLDIGLSGRPLTNEERAQGLREERYARTPFVFAAHMSLPWNGVRMEDIVEIYAGKRDWENGRRIRLVLRPEEDSDIPVLRRISPAMKAAVDIALRRQGMIVSLTDHDAADAIETVPGAFGGTTLSLVLSEKRGVRVLSIDGVAPTVRAMADGAYPYFKTFYMITKKSPGDSVRRFMEFVRSPAGKAILAANGQEAFPR